MSEPLVSVVIPTHNRREKLKYLIKSILESDYRKDKLEIIVVDDASSDGTREYVKKLFPQIKVVRNETERLLAASRNIGVRVSKGKYIFIVDDDNVVDRNTIKELVEFMEQHPEVGVVGPIMYFFRDPKRIWCAGVRRNYWTTITKFIYFNTVDDGSLREPYESEDFPNAFIVRRKVIEKVGVFNSKLFPIHYDEADFCQRVRRAGYKIMVVPTAKVWHDISLPEQSRASLLHLKNPLRAYYTVRNRILYHFLWSKNVLQRFVAVLASLAITAYYVIVVLMSAPDYRCVVLRAMIKGVIDSFRLMKEALKYHRFILCSNNGGITVNNIKTLNTNI